MKKIIDDSSKPKIIPSIIGAILLFFYIYSKINPLMFEDMFNMVYAKIANVLVVFILRIIGALWCYNISKSHNRNTTFWIIFAFLIPALALFIIGFLKGYKIIDETNAENK